MFLSQSFPYLSDRLPALAQQGAFSAKEACASPFNPLPPPRPPPEKTIAAAAEENMASSCTYSTAELKSLVAYAAVRKEKKRKEKKLQIRSTQPRPNLIKSMLGLPLFLLHNTGPWCPSGVGGGHTRTQRQLVRLRRPRSTCYLCFNILIKPKNIRIFAKTGSGRAQYNGKFPE